MIGVVAFFSISRNADDTEGKFTPPPFDKTAQTGAPADTADSYDFIEFPMLNDVCRIYLDANPELDGDSLKVLLTSPAENKALIRIVLYDAEAMSIIGESGVIRSGEYIEGVTLSKKPSSGEEIKVKLITYEPDTYYSLGSINATIVVR